MLWESFDKKFWTMDESVALSRQAELTPALATNTRRPTAPFKVTGIGTTIGERAAVLATARDSLRERVQKLKPTE